MPELNRITEDLVSIVKESPAEFTEIIILQNQGNLTRFTHSSIHQNMSVKNNLAFVRIIENQRQAASRLNQIDRVYLQQKIRELQQIVRHTPANPNLCPPQKTTPYSGRKIFFQETSSISLAEKAKILKKAFQQSARTGAELAGSFYTGMSQIIIANSNGLFTQEKSSKAFLKMVPVKDGSLAYAEYTSHNVHEIPVESLLEKALDICNRNTDPMDLPPGKYTVILEPECLAEILEWLAFSSFATRNYLDGNSFLSGKMGQKVMGPNISIYDSTEEPEYQDLGFDFEGVTKKKVFLVKNGIASGMVYDTVTGQEAGCQSTGHALLPGISDSPLPLNLCLTPGSSSIQKMIENCEYGIYICRFHYVNGYLDIPRALMTGMTRYGTFLVEEGHLTHTLKNLRWTQSWLDAFSRVSSLTKERKIVSGWWGDFGSLIVPGACIKDFNITGSTA